MILNYTFTIPLGGVLAEGITSGEHVFCPMHDWKINIVDGKVQAPDVGCVKTFEVEVENDTVFLVLRSYVFGVHKRRVDIRWRIFYIIFSRNIRR
jgi:hypothetical protein